MRRPFRRRCYGTLRRRERAMRPPTGDHGGCRRHLGCVDHQYSAPGGQLPVALLLKRVIASCFTRGVKRFTLHLTWLQRKPPHFLSLRNLPG
jgi:hypothetical protein